MVTAPAATWFYSLSLHDALPISHDQAHGCGLAGTVRAEEARDPARQHIEAQLVHGQCRAGSRDRKSTRLNSSHANISYAVFCLKKKKHGKPGCARAFVDRTRTDR